MNAKSVAHDAVTTAVRRGWLKREPCEVCGNQKSEAHHDDYGKPLEVRWLCRLHHDDEHRPDKHAPLSTPFATRVRRARYQAGFSQNDLARVMQISSRAVQTWEQGTRMPQARHLRRLATATGKSLAWFFLEEDQELAA